MQVFNIFFYQASESDGEINLIDKPTEMKTSHKKSHNKHGLNRISSESGEVQLKSSMNGVEKSDGEIGGNVNGNSNGHQLNKFFTSGKKFIMNIEAKIITFF